MFDIQAVFIEIPTKEAMNTRWYYDHLQATAKDTSCFNINIIFEVKMQTFVQEVCGFQENIIERYLDIFFLFLCA